MPGLLYLVALNAIAAEQLSAARETVQIAVYNVLWFLLPVTALVLAIVAPDSAQRYLSAATDWTRRHQDRLVLVLFTALGAYLVLKGGLQLATR
jgi:threonine/homoserine/homoserine lactone efflux protein